LKKHIEIAQRAESGPYSGILGQLDESRGKNLLLQIQELDFGHGSILGGSLNRSLGMAKLQEWCNHPQILRI